MKIEINKEYTFTNDQFLWRYVDLHRLIYFLNTGNIFFSPLSAFFDPLEGITEKHLHDKEYLDAIDKRADEEGGLPRKNRKLLEEKEEIKERFKSGLGEIQKKYFASCWYLGVRESLAMWDSYSNKDSVALRFNPAELCKTIIDNCRNTVCEDFSTMIHGKVEYYNISPFNPNDDSLKNCGHRFKGFLKDLSYKHEEEFRFIVIQNDEDNTYQFFELNLKNLQSLDFQIVTHPHMESWKHNNIYNILKTKGIESKLRTSDIPTRRQVFDTPY